MKQNEETANQMDDLREQYDFNYDKAKPNRFAEQFGDDTIVVVLDPDVAVAFPTSEAVNKALRLVIELSLISSVKA
jgi:hypothetical protein